MKDKAPAIILTALAVLALCFVIHSRIAAASSCGLVRDSDERHMCYALQDNSTGQGRIGIGHGKANNFTACLV